MVLRLLFLNIRRIQVLGKLKSLNNFSSIHYEVLKKESTFLKDH